MFYAAHKCEVCGDKCPLYISHPLFIKENGDWEFQIEIHDKPTYFIGDIFFCGAECGLKWYQENRS